MAMVYFLVRFLAFVRTVQTLYNIYESRGGEIGIHVPLMPRWRNR